MSRLENLSKDKFTIMERLLTHQGICKALKYTESDFLDMPDVIDPFELIGDKVFPYYRVPDTETDTSTYILISFRNYRPAKYSFKSGIINIFAITHKDLVMTDHGFLRYDYMISEIDKLMNDERGIGMGKLNFVGMDEVSSINDAFIGNVISYKPVEFN